MRFEWKPKHAGPALVSVVLPLLLVACFSRSSGEKSTGGQANAKDRGAEIYRTTCAKCHGANGEGVADKYDEPLFGDRSVESLAKLISRTMPEDDPGTCTGEDATKVAAYIYDAFYSPVARARHEPPRVQLSRLTVRQYETTVADLVGSFRPAKAQLDSERGLSGQYYNSRNFQGNKRVLERVDPRIDFSFGDQTPDAK